MPRPPSRLLNPPSPWTPGNLPVWDVLSVKSALLGHEEGLFEQSALMAAAMGRDDRIVAVMETRIMGLLSLPFQVIPAEVTRAKVKSRRIAEAVEAHWPEIAPLAQISSIMWWNILMGVAPVQIRWAVASDGLWIPSIKAWNPQFMFWMPEEHVYKINTREGLVDVIPENGWFLLTQGDRGFMQGAIRSISNHWLSRQFVLRDWNRFNERHGLPILKAMVPSRSEESEKDEFAQNMSQIGSTTTALLPQNVDGDNGSYDLELLEAKDQAWKSFPGLEDSSNKNIAVRILGQNLTTEVTSGSLAAANIHNMIRLERLEGDANLLGSAIRDEVLTQFVKFNFGEDAMFAPLPKWETAPPTDLIAKGQSLKELGEGITALKTAGLKLSDKTVEELGQEYDLELIPGELPDQPTGDPPTQDEPDTDEEEELEEAS